MGRLRKRDVEALLARYDAQPEEALRAALALVLDRPGAGYEDLVRAAPLTEERRAALLARRLDALDALAAELNEQRTLAGPPGR